MERFKMKPLDHQIRCLNDHGRKEFFALLAEQGTGKTFIIINNIADLWSSHDLDAVLVFAPNGVHTNWTLREIPKTMPDYVRYRARSWAAGMGKAKQKKFDEIYDTTDSSELRILTMNWDALVTDKGYEAAKKFCTTCSKLAIVCDESQNIKNPKAGRTKALMKLKQYSTYRRIMTGTPISNSPFDAFSQFMFLDENILETTSYRSFCAEYAEMLTERSGLLRHIVNKKIKLNDNELRSLNDSMEGLKSILVKNGRAELIEAFSSVSDAHQVGAYDSMGEAIEHLKSLFSPTPSRGRQLAMSHVYSIEKVLASYDRRATSAFNPNRLPQIIAKDKEGKKKYRNLDKLKKLIEPHSFRVLKKDCLDLPDKVYKTAYFEMTKEQAEIYRKAKEEGRLVLDGEDTPFNRLVIYGKLSQITSGYYLHPEREEPVRIPGANEKLRLLKERIETIVEEGNKAIVWARYHVEIDDICAVLKEAGINYVEYHGRVKKGDREAAIDGFELGEASVFVGQQKAGGAGLTLNAASYVFYFSNTFSLTDREQSEDRAHRIGQTKSVTYMNLIAQGTIDEQIVDALQDKKNVADITLSFDS